MLGDDRRVASNRMSSLEPPLAPALPTANVPPPPCVAFCASLNLFVGPAPATSAWWALGAGAIIRAFPCSALVVSAAESWHSNPRPSFYLRATQPTRSDSARAACELGTNRRPPRACPPGTLSITAGIDSNSRRPPSAALPLSARLFRSLGTVALRPFQVARCLSAPTAVDPRPYLPLPSHLPCLSSVAQANGPRRSPVPPAPPSPLRSALVH